MAKFKFLESIRGIGALSVVLFHYLEVFYPAFVTGNPAQQHLGYGIETFFYSTPLRLLVNGPAAVAVFFVLSGYVLTYKYFKTRDTQTLVSGAVRRYFRLLPVILAVELLAYLCLRFSLYAYAGQLPAVTLTKTWISAYNVPADLPNELYEAFIGAFIANQHHYDVPLWTMTYEFLGSMLVFSAALFGSKIRNRMWLFVALVILFHDSYYSGFVLGMILSDLSQRPDMPLRRWIHPRLNIGLGIVGLFLLSFPAYTDFADQTLYRFMHIHLLETKLVIYYYTWGAFFFLLAVLNSTRAQTLLSSRPLVYLGRISFPLYAVHWIILGSFSSFLFIQLNHFLSYPLAFLGTFALSILLIFGLSELIKQFVDDPGIKASNWIYQQLFKPAPVQEKQTRPVHLSNRIAEIREKEF